MTQTADAGTGTAECKRPGCGNLIPAQRRPGQAPRVLRR